MTFAIGNNSKLRHGHARRGAQTAEHRIWQSMKRRCIDPNHSKFKYYGGAGVSICKEWLDSFESFLADMGPRPSPTHSLDRFPNRRGNYEPGNVRWATKQEQSDNRACTRLVAWEGRDISLRALCATFNVNLKAIRRRVDIGWDIGRALSVPVATVPFRPRRKATS